MSSRWEKLPAESSGWAAAHTLYGVEGRKNDEHDREAYASCMRSRGYGS